MVTEEDGSEVRVPAHRVILALHAGLVRDLPDTADNSMPIIANGFDVATVTEFVRECQSRSIIGWASGTSLSETIDASNTVRYRCLRAKIPSTPQI